MTGRLTDLVERLTGRSVATYQSQVMFDDSDTGDRVGQAKRTSTAR